MLNPNQAISTMPHGAVVNTTFNGADQIWHDEFVVKCVCGITFIAHPKTKSCVACNSNQLTVIIHCP